MKPSESVIARLMNNSNVQKTTAEWIVYMLVANTIVTFFVTILLQASQGFRLAPYIFNLVFAAFFMGLLIPIRKGHFRTAVFVGVGINFIFTLLQIWLDGGIISPNFYELLLAIMLWILAYGVGGGLLTGIISLVAGIAFTFFQPHPTVYSTGENLILQLSTFFTIVVYFFFAYRLFQIELRENIELTKELSKREKRLKDLIHNLPLGAMVFGLTGEISLVNERLTKITGYSSLELKTAEDWYRLVQPDTELSRKFRENFDAEYSEDQRLSFMGELEISSRYGQRIDVESFATQLGDEIIVLLNDISARKKAENEIERKFSQLSSLRTLDLAIVNSEGLSELFGIFFSQIAVQLGADAIWVMLNDSSQPDAFEVFTYGQMHSDSFLLDGSSPEIRKLMGTSQPKLLRNNAAIIKTFGENTSKFEFSAAIPMVTKNGAIGLLAIFRLDAYHPDADWLRFLEALSGQTAIGIDRISLTDNLKTLNQNLVSAYDATIQGWARALELRDKETEGHSRRVAEMTLRLARAIGIAGTELQDIYRGALLHDIGKMPIPDNILLKNGPLTDEEWVLMRKHPETAYHLLQNIPFLTRAVEIPYGHHEHWDGSGYPRGLKGEEIPLAARVFAFADVWDALRSDRPYREAWPVEKVLDYILEKSGKQFDPQIAAVFESMIRTQPERY